MAALAAGPTLEAAASDVGRMLRAAASLLWAAVAWILYKSLQATVGGVFIALILGQTAVAGVLRWLRPSAAFAKVQAARQAQDAGITAATAAAEPATATGPKAAGPNAEPQPQKPLHIFPDPKHGHDSLVCQLIGPYMRNYGRHAIANSQLFNPEYIHFFVPGLGALPYVVSDVFNRVAIVGTGEPLAARADWRALTQLFLQEFPKAYFYHITEEYADLLHDMGYWINGCGTETTLQVQSWAYSSKTRTIRASARSARDSGVRVRELKPEELTDDMRAKLQHDVTGCWLQQKAIADRELRVFVRGVDYDHLELRDGIRIFVAEAYDPAVAPPAHVDPVLQGAALNAKPPKPPRRSRSLKNALSCEVPSRNASTSSLSAAAVSSLRQTHSTSSLQPIKAPSAAPTPAVRATRADAAACAAAPAAETDAAAAAEAFVDASGGGSDSDQSRSGSYSLNSDCVARLEGLDTDDSDGSPMALAAAAAAAAAGGKSLGMGMAGGALRRGEVPKGHELRVEDSANLLHHLGKIGSKAGGVESRPMQIPSDTAAAAHKDQDSKRAVSISAVGTSAAPQPSAVLGAPELVGFVLLDPLWEGGQEVGYVTSIMRMKRSAHQGTLKLLIEDIVSNLRKEGKRELTFGFAPLYNVNDTGERRYIHWIRWVSLYLYYCANNVYAFQNLAFSKTRYGAGLDATGQNFNDPNVKATHVYLAVKHYTPGWSMIELYSFFNFLGIIEDPVGVFLKLLGVRKGGENLK